MFYKAGRTEAGRAAAQGHTASLAGDWSVSYAAAVQAGALVAMDFLEFQDLIELSLALHAKEIGGLRVAAVSNAGFETVGMADSIRGNDYCVKLHAICSQTQAQLGAVLQRQGLSSLVNLRNPLDITPMATDEAYEQCIQVLLDAQEFDALVVGCVPMTPQLLTTPNELDREGSIAGRLVRIFNQSRKPLVVVVDSASPYELLVDRIRRHGVPVFRSADRAMKSLGRYLAYRIAGAQQANKR